MSQSTSSTQRRLRISSYDRVSSWLVALLVITGLTVGGLLSVYLTRILIVSEIAIPVTAINAPGGGGGTGGITSGVGNDLEPPGVEEAPDLAEAALQDTLSAVASASTTKVAILDDQSLDTNIDPVQGKSSGDQRSPGSGGGRGGGIGTGVGTGFGPGKGGPGEPRREIRFEPESLREYAQWLDFFHIELGVLGGDNQVYYAYNLSQAKPDTRVGNPAEEQRLYMNPTDVKFSALDRRLAEKAGIADKGKIILQFFPTEAQAILLELEQKKAGTRRPEDIRRTVFRVTRTGDKFEFSVEDQSYR